MRAKPLHYYAMQLKGEGAVSVCVMVFLCLCVCVCVCVCECMCVCDKKRLNAHCTAISTYIESINLPSSSKSRKVYNSEPSLWVKKVIGTNSVLQLLQDASLPPTIHLPSHQSGHLGFAVLQCISESYFQANFSIKKLILGPGIY